MVIPEIELNMTSITIKCEKKSFPWPEGYKLPKLIVMKGKIKEPCFRFFRN